MNKVISKQIFKKNKIKSPKYFVIDKKNITKKKKLINLITKNKINFPIVVKPINEGSSIGVRISKNIKTLDNFTKDLFKKYSELIFEPYIGGQEIQVAVINGKPLGAIELNLKENFMITKQNIQNQPRHFT